VRPGQSAERRIVCSIKGGLVGVGHWPLLELAGALSMDCLKDGYLLLIFLVVAGFFDKELSVF
jgi:hypothetical protein